MTLTTDAADASAATANFVIGEEGNIDNKEFDKNQQQKSLNAEESNENDENDLNKLKILNKESNTIPVQFSNSSIVSPDSDSKMSTSTDRQSMKTNTAPETSSSLVDKKTSNNESNNNNDDGEGDEDDEYAEPYNELLVQFLDEANQIVSLIIIKYYTYLHTCNFHCITVGIYFLDFNYLGFYAGRKILFTLHTY